jgi:hypothetical protein
VAGEAFRDARFAAINLNLLGAIYWPQRADLLSMVGIQPMLHKKI